MMQMVIDESRRRRAVGRLRRMLGLVLCGLTAIAGAAAAGEPAPAVKNEKIRISADAMTGPRLLVAARGESMTVEADLPSATTRHFSLVPTSNGRWVVVLSVFDGKALSAFQYPLAIGSAGTIPTPPQPGPQPGPPAPKPTPPQPSPPPGPGPQPGPGGELAKLVLAAAQETVPAEGRKAQASALAAGIEAALKRTEPGYTGEDKLRDPAALRSAMPAAAARALAKDNDRWIAWSARVAEAMDRLQAAGKLADMDAYRAAYQQIIQGLREVP